MGTSTQNTQCCAAVANASVPCEEAVLVLKNSGILSGTKIQSKISWFQKTDP